MKCPYCGREFKPPSNNPAQKFCSRFCYERHRSGGLPQKRTETCAYCGRKFTPPKGNLGQKFCSASCYKKHRLGIPLQKTKTETKPLEQWAKEAVACNLDYGTYRTLINSGKTFEELKATAHLRTLQAHSHSHFQHGMKGEKLT